MSKKGKLNFYKYRHFISAIIIIIIVIIIDIISENYTKKSIDKINGDIEKIYNSFKEEDKKYNLKELEKLSQNATIEWEKREGILTCFIEHEEIEKISVKLNILNIEINNMIWNDAISTSQEVLQLIKYLNDKHKLSIKNIF